MDFKNYEEWSKNQSRIYSEFEEEAENLVELGLNPKKNILNGKGDGYLIGLQHSSETARRVFDLSKKISEITKGVIYSPQNVHTTLTSILEENFKPNEGVLAKLAEIAETMLKLNLKTEISFDDWLINQDSVIAKGIPDKNFYEMGRFISETSQQKWMELRMPKMAHITTSRFVEDATVEKINQILNLLKSTQPIGVSRPECLVVGYFYTSEEKFELHPYKKWKL